MSVKQNTVVFKRIVKTGFLNFVRNAWLGIAAMAVMVITLTIILFSIIANATFANTVQQITDRIDVSVYLNDSVTIKQRDELINNLKGLENVEGVTYISKDQALVIYKQQNVGNSDLLTAISQTDNPLPASLQKLRALKQLTLRQLNQLREMPNPTALAVLDSLTIEG